MFEIRYFAVLGLDGGSKSRSATAALLAFDEQHELSAVLISAAGFSSAVGTQQPTARGSAKGVAEQHELVIASLGFICGTKIWGMLALETL